MLVLNACAMCDMCSAALRNPECPFWTRDPTFGYWEKIICFWRAPVTIYLSNVVVQVVVLVLFTQFLAASSEVASRLRVSGTGIRKLVPTCLQRARPSRAQTRGNTTFFSTEAGIPVLYGGTTFFLRPAFGTDGGRGGAKVMYDAWDAFEFFLAFFFAASTITESLQILLDGFGSYIEDFWNCIGTDTLFVELGPCLARVGHLFTCI